MASDDNTNDLVLLPNDFNSILLPELLIEFFEKFEIQYKTTNSFPMSILRSLYRADYKSFYNVVYFLSLYGCNFHSVKNNSFFPADVNNVEDILTFSGPAESCFSIADMNRYGIWDFCTNASSSKCMLLNGVVVSRLKKTSENTFAKLNDCQLISITSKRLYGADLPNEASDEISEESEIPDPSSIPAEPGDESNISELYGNRKNIVLNPLVGEEYRNRSMKKTSPGCVSAS